MQDTIKAIAFGSIGIIALGAMMYGKWKLATLGTAWWIVILGGIVFAASNSTKVAGMELPK